MQPVQWIALSPIIYSVHIYITLMSDGHSCHIAGVFPIISTFIAHLQRNDAVQSNID